MASSDWITRMGGNNFWVQISGHAAINQEPEGVMLALGDHTIPSLSPKAFPTSWFLLTGPLYGLVSPFQRRLAGVRESNRSWGEKLGFCRLFVSGSRALVFGKIAGHFAALQGKVRQSN